MNMHALFILLRALEKKTAVPNITIFNDMKVLY